jgi:predicted flap endonuclease-1-like 5' DNA nuclease
MSITIVTALSLAALLVGFLTGWLVSGLSTNLTMVALLGLPVLAIGFLIGWIVEWIIDNQYRKPRGVAGSGPETSEALAEPEPAEEGVAELAHTVQDVLDDRQDAIEQLQAELERQTVLYDELKEAFREYVYDHPDDLTVIKGIGPVYQWRLYDAGIRTYSQLASSTPEELQAAMQLTTWQRAEPESWIDQAKALSQRPKGQD